MCAAIDGYAACRLNVNATCLSGSTVITGLDSLDVRRIHVDNVIAIGLVGIVSPLNSFVATNRWGWAVVNSRGRRCRNSGRSGNRDGSSNLLRISKGSDCA